MRQDRSEKSPVLHRGIAENENREIRRKFIREKYGELTELEKESGPGARRKGVALNSWTGGS